MMRCFPTYTGAPVSIVRWSIHGRKKASRFQKKKWFVQNVFQLCLVGSRHIFSTRHFEFLAVCKETGWQCLVSIESLSFSSVCGQCAFVSKARGCSVTVDFVRWESIPVPCGYEVGAWVIGPSDGPRKGRWSLLIHSVRLRRTGMPLKKKNWNGAFLFPGRVSPFFTRRTR